MTNPPLIMSLLELRMLADVHADSPHADNLRQTVDSILTNLSVSAEQVETVAEAVDSASLRVNLSALDAAMDAADTAERFGGHAELAQETHALADQTCSSSQQVMAVADPAMEIARMASEILRDLAGETGLYRPFPAPALATPQDRPQDWGDNVIAFPRRRR